MALEYLKKILMSGLNVNKKGTLEEELDSLGTGGSGGAADAVKYTSQELTEEQQMQARKNLGLYYKESDATVIEWDGDTTGRATIDFDGMPLYCKVFDRVLALSELIGANVTTTKDLSIELLPRYVKEVADGLIMVADIGIVSARAGTYDVFDSSITVPEDGVYFPAIEIEGRRITRLEKIGEMVSKIDEKFIPDSIARGKNYVFEGSDASWNELVAAATEFQDGRATIVWNGQHVLEASVGDDAVYIRFANNSYCVNTYTDDGSHLVTSYSPDESGYDDLNAEKIRFFRDDPYHSIGSLIAKDDNTINVSGKFVFDNDSLIIRASDNYNKHFKITVNSQGVLSATEVTSNS